MLAGLVATAVLCMQLPSAEAQRAPAQKLRIVGGLAGLNQYVQHEEPFWSRRLAQVSGGRFGAEIVPFDRAGVPAQDMLRLMQMGVIPFGTAQISSVAVQDAEFSAVDLAGLNPDMATLRKTVATFRPFLERTLRQRYGLELLAVYVYPAQMLFCNKPLTGLADLTGRRIRVSGTSTADFVAALGAQPVLTGMAEVLSSIRSGRVDCAITGSMSGNTVGLHEVTSHIFTMPVTWGLSIFGANQNSWNSLDPELRMVLRSELPKLEAEIWAANEKETAAGVACNVGAADCSSGRKGHMQAVAARPQDDERRKELLRTQILPRWLRRCGPSCAEVWNQTIGPQHGITVTSAP